MSNRRKSQRGGSALEVALMLPWYIFLFIGTFDWGYYAHALISTEAAARTAVLYTAQSASTAANQSVACILANEEMRIVPNIGSSSSATCTSSPLIVTAVQAGIGQTTNSADTSQASQVTVTYTTVGLIPIPGLLTKQATFYRVTQMRLGT